MAAQNKNRLWWPILVLAVLTACGLLVARGASNLSQVQEDLEQLSRTNQTLDRENQTLYREVERLRNDPQATQRASRRQMGLVRQDEVVYQEASPEPSNPAKGSGAHGRENP